MTNTKTKIKKVPTQQSVAFKRQMAIGSAIVKKLPQLATRPEVGKVLGISDEMVRRIECQALFKIHQQLHAALKEQFNEQ